jgi:hypothetical protein
MANQLHDHLLSTLKSSGMDEKTLKAIASDVASIDGGDLLAARILTKGTPRPDLARVSGIARRDAIAKLLASIIERSNHLGGIQVFPYGIPYPDVYHVDIDIGPGAGR